MFLIIASIIIYIFAALLQLKLKNETKPKFLIVANAIATICALIPVAFTLASGLPLIQYVNLGAFMQLQTLRLDTLSAFFVLIITSITLLGTIYTKGYLAHYIENGKKVGAHLFGFNIFIASMILVALAHNVVFFLISWEIMSFASFILMLFEDEEKEVRQTAINYLITMHVGVLFLIFGFVMMIVKTGSLDFKDYINNVDGLVFLLVSVGFGIKAGLLPLHTWLPKAHPVAPTHISAMMSGVMIKTGIYGILRFFLFLDKPTAAVGYSILVVGLLSAFFGILYAVAQRNFKRLLAYSSVENMGIVFIGFGIGVLGIVYQNYLMASAGFLGCFMHCLNHSLFKPLMFFAAGAVYTQTHTKDMEKLGGLIKTMKQTGTLFLLGSLAISALPPFNGFISEMLIYMGLLSSFVNGNYFLFTIIIFGIGVLAFVGAMALIAFSGAFSIIFLGSQRSETANSVKNDVPISMRLPMTVLASLCLLIGIFPQIFVKLAALAISPKLLTVIPEGLLNILSIVNLTLLALIAAILLFRQSVLQDKQVEINKVWGCGYQYPNSKMQYTSNSYTRPFLGFLTPFFVKTLDFRQIKELFPKKTYFKAKIHDIFEYYLIKPLVSADESFLSKFLWIQSGNTQRYLIYGVVFLLVAIALLLGGVI